MKSIFICLASCCLFVACADQNDSELIECSIESVLDDRNMIAYSGQEIGCKFFLELYHFQDKQFFLLGNHCVDMISYPIDCQRNSLCAYGEDSECEEFFASAERIGIVGIDK